MAAASPCRRGPSRCPRARRTACRRCGAGCGLPRVLRRRVDAGRPSAAVLTQNAWPSTRPRDAPGGREARGRGPGRRETRGPARGSGPSPGPRPRRPAAGSPPSAAMRPRRRRRIRQRRAGSRSRAACRRPRRCRCASAQPGKTKLPSGRRHGPRARAPSRFAGSPTKTILPPSRRIEARAGFGVRRRCRRRRSREGGRPAERRRRDAKRGGGSRREARTPRNLNRGPPRGQVRRTIRSVWSSYCGTSAGERLDGVEDRARRLAGPVPLGDRARAAGRGRTPRRPRRGPR